MNTRNEPAAPFRAIGHPITRLATLAALLIAAQTPANGATWTGLSSKSSNWSDSANWLSGILPVAHDDLFFGGNNRTTNFYGSKAPLSVNAIDFNGKAAAFTIHVVAGNTLTIAGAGVTNSSANTQTLINDAGTSGGSTVFSNSAAAGTLHITNVGSAVGGTSFGSTLFETTSSAGSATITNGGATASGFHGGVTQFINASIAGSATITNNGGTLADTGGFVEGGSTEFFDTSSASGASITNNATAALGTTYGGFTEFYNASTAGSATITTNGATISGSFIATGATGFFNTSTAGSATIITNGGQGGGVLDGAYGGTTDFTDSSTAGSATIITTGGSEIFGGRGGRTVFYNTSDGGTARAITSGNGYFDISGLSTTGMGIGSIEGSGIYYLGSKNLSVGGNNLSTTVAGVIQDGGFGGGTGGSLTKVGSGALTLSGANTYTGNTTINSGTLVVDGSIAGAAIVNAGGILKGIGTIAGNLSNPGGSINPGDSPGVLTTNGSYVQGSGGTLVVEIGGPPQGSQYDQLKVNGSATLAGTLDVNLTGGFSPVLGDRFDVLTFANHSGVFGTYLDLNLGGHMSFKPLYDATSLTLRAAPTQDGDLNLDGIVDISDVQQVANWWPPKSYDPHGDANLDDHVDVSDIQTIAANWLHTDPGPGSGMGVPEPPAMVLAILGSVGLACGARRGARRAGTGRGNRIARLATLAALLIATQAPANGAVWTGASASTSNWADSANWQSGILPVANDDLFFGSFNNHTTNFQDYSPSKAGLSVNSIDFNKSAAAYTIHVIAGQSLTIAGAGVTNSSKNTQTLINDVAINSSGSTTFSNSASAGTLHITNVGFAPNSPGYSTQFVDTSTAANATITNKCVTSFNSLPGRVDFRNTSTAGSATIINEGGPGTNAFGGETYFFDASSAGSATITNKSGVGEFEVGFSRFDDTSSAGSATITNNGGTVGGENGAVTLFHGTSTAGSATITSQGGAVTGAIGARTLFFDTSDGGTARAITNGNGNFDISGLSTTGMGIGSIDGSGNYFLGSKNLTAGGNNLSTTVSGAIQDGGNTPGTGGSLTKVGSGTLTLSGANTYTGFTTVNGGALVVDGSLAGTAYVNAGGTFKGTGTIASHLINVGGSVNPGASPGPGVLTVNGVYLQESGGTLVVEIGGLTPGSQYDQLKIAYNAELDGTLDVNLINGFSPALGDSFTVLTFTGQSGGFATYVDLDLGGHLSLRPLFNALTLKLQAVPTLDGDLTLDAIVDISDVQRVAAHWLTTSPLGDANVDNFVDISDIQTIAAHYLQSGGGSGMGVPEPPAMVLAIVGLVGLAFGQGRGTSAGGKP